jgi:hypothetical protein
MKSLALGFESFRSQNLKIQAFFTLASSSKGWVVHELPVATYQKMNKRVFHEMLKGLS